MIRAILLFGFLGVFAMGVYHSLFVGEGSSLKNITITGAGPETEARIREKLASKVGTSLWGLDVGDVATALRQDNWIESVEVRRRVPQTLVIDVSERKPLAVLSSGRGQFKFIDNRDFIVGEADAAQVADYPVLSGTNLLEKSELRQKALSLLEELPPEGFVSRTDVSEVRYSDDRGFQVILSKTGLVVDLGKENLPLHLERSRRVVQYLDQHSINATHIDSDYAKKVLVKVRKGR